MIWFLRLSPLLAVTSSSADQVVVPSFQDPETGLMPEAGAHLELDAAALKDALGPEGPWT